MAFWISLISAALSAFFIEDRRRQRSRGSRSASGRSEEEEEGANDNTRQRKHDKSINDDASFLQSIRGTLSLLLHPSVGPLLFVKFLNGISSSAFTTVQPLILANELHFSTSTMGYYMSSSMLSVAAFAAAGISPAMSLAGNKPDRLARWGVGCRLASVAVFGAAVARVLSRARLPVGNTDGDGGGGARTAATAQAATLASP